jgi:hypothetical protein
MKTKHIALGAAVMGIAYFVIKNKKAKGLACPPTDEKTKLTFSSIQLGVNLLLTQQNKSRIGLTGTIDGPTVDAVNSLLGTKFATCADLANRAGEIKRELDRQVQTKLGGSISEAASDFVGGIFG